MPLPTIERIEARLAGAVRWTCLILPMALLIIWAVGGNSILVNFQKISAFTLLLALSASLTSYLIRAWRWRDLVDIHRQMPWWAWMVVFLAGLGLTASPGKVGELARYFFARPWGLRWPQVLIGYLAERGMDVLVAGSLGITLYWFGQSHSYLALTLIVVPIVVILLLSCLRSWFARQAARLLRRNLAASGLPSAIRNILHLSRLARNGVLSVVAWLVQGCGFIFIAAALIPFITPEQAMAVFLVAMVIGAASGIPGGLGATEAGLALGLLHLGASWETAFSTAVIFRVTSLWFATGLGLLAYGLGPFRWATRSAAG